VFIAVYNTQFLRCLLLFCIAYGMILIGVIILTLKELRKAKGLSQLRCAAILGMPIRTYQNYENDPNKQGSMKYMYMMQQLEQYGFIDESHGIVPFSSIKEGCERVFQAHDVQYCYLFGSYAKGTATETSDIDLLISTSVTGILFYELVESIREELRKKVDVLTIDQLKDNTSLANEILKDGVKIYG